LENILAGTGKCTVDNLLCNEVWLICSPGCGNAHSAQKTGMSWTHLQDGWIKNTKEMLEGKKYMVVDQRGSQTTGGEML
jgi:hypothetical protein